MPLHDKPIETHSPKIASNEPTIPTSTKIIKLGSEKKLQKYRDLLIEGKTMVARYKLYQAFKNRPHFKELLEWVERVEQELD